MFGSRSYVFLGLNAVRALSLIGLILVFSSSIVTLVHDVKAVNAFVKAGQTASDNSTTTTNYEYIADSTVPNQPAGAAFAVINRLLIIAQVIMIALSEVGWPQVFFDRFFPILGSEFGLGALGIMQLLLGCQILSHFVDTFSLVSAFFLASIGCVNMLLGLIFRSKARPRRALFNWKERAQDAKDMLPPPVGAAVSIGTNIFTNLHNKKDAETGSMGSTEKSADSLKGLPERFQGMGFGRQAEKAAAGKGIFISRPLESLPRYASSAASSLR
ncbi:hypothetical protein PENSPDRAFT_674952 [Peniophora sp. CONT]|nr:hypothetical protein PENSPDRAFT_674952 [Peniophora sp. CONT]